MSEAERALRERIRIALDSREQAQLDGLSLELGLSREHPLAWVGQLMRDEFDKSSHEVQQYWLGECNCTGHLN